MRCLTPMPGTCVEPATILSGPRPTLRQTDTAAGALQAAVLQERARLARELHDGVSQTLYAITRGASNALTHLQRNETTDVQRLIDDVLRLANTGQSELCDLLTNINSNRLTSAGLGCALEQLAAETRTRDSQADLDIRVAVAHEPDVPTPIQDALLMIVREALHNVVRHADAHCVDIVLECGRGRLMLLIEDDGRGFDPLRPRPGHFGLQSMRERVAAVGGALAVFSAVGAGTQLRVSIPLPADIDG